MPGGAPPVHGSGPSLASFHDFGFSFRYPSTWKRADWCWRGTLAAPLTVLTTADTAPVCKAGTATNPTPKSSAFPPAMHLADNGIAVWWWTFGRPGFESVKLWPGQTTHIAGRVARVDVVSRRAMREQKLSPGCGTQVNGERAVTAAIRYGGGSANWLLVVGCLRGPNFASNQVAVRRMLVSLRFEK